MFDCYACGGKGLITFEYNANTGIEARIGEYDAYENVYATKNITMHMTDVLNAFISIDHNLVTHNS